MKEQIIYKDDLIGLKTLDQQNKIFLREVKNAAHTEWSIEWMTDEILPFLYKKTYDIK